MGDKLFAIRNNFYLGGFQHCISECSQATGLTDSERIERDVFLYRSYIELGTYDVGLVYVVYSLSEALQRSGLVGCFSGVVASHTSAATALRCTHILSPAAPATHTTRSW